jgi:arylsulfatase A-like enzyme
MFNSKKPITDKVILISIDNLRYDCVGYQPDKKELDKYNVKSLLETPTLDSLSEKALCFTQCISTNTYTTAAHASVFTGLYPPHHGVRAFFDTKLNKDVKTLAEIFKENGYITVFATDVMALFKPLDLTRGFDYLFERDDQGLLAFLEKHKSEKVFLFVHFFDVHEPYLFSETPQSKDYNNDYFDFMEALYKQHGIEIKDRKPHTLWRDFSNGINRNIEYMLPIYVKGVAKFDNGRLKFFIETLEKINFFNKSLTVIFSDHGEGKCDQNNKNFFSHGGDLYDNVLRVPLLVLHKDLKPATDSRLLSISDIFGLVIEYAGINPKLEYVLDAVPLDKQRKEVFSEKWAPHKNADLSEDEHGNPLIPHQFIKDNEWLLSQRAIRTNDMKFVVRGKQEDLVDLNDKNVDDEQFIKALYRKVLGRWEDPGGLEYHVMTLRKQFTDRRHKLIEFLSSEEARSNPSFFSFDLKADPYEETPITAASDINTLKNFQQIINILLEIEKEAIFGERIFYDNHTDAGKVDEEKEKIVKQLKDLGYF